MLYKLLVSLMLTLTACSPTRQLTSSNAMPWENLFDGSSVEKLKGYQNPNFPAEAWVVENGSLKAVTGGKNADLLTKEQYKNFELAFDWKVSKGGNSGVFFHVQEDQKQEPGNGNSPNWLRNYEMQLLDDVNFYDKEPKRSAGALYDLITPQNKELKPVGEWNTARLVVRGQQVEHWINGRKVVTYQMGSPEMVALIQGSKFKNIKGFAQYDDGYIMFQHHGQEVGYRNIKIRRLTYR